MARVTINGVTVDVAPGQTVSSDSGGNISITDQSGQVLQQRPSLGRVVAEGAALGVGVGVGLGIGEGIVDAVSDLF